MSVDAEANRLERLAQMLEATGDFRVLRRLRSPACTASYRTLGKRAVFLDVETTGLNFPQDTVIELAMLPFDYDADGQILSIGEPYQGFRDPGVPICPEVSALTGITDAMVAKTSIDPQLVESIVREAAIVIAHNSRFDRPFCEHLWPIFASKPWACTWQEVEWKAEGFGGSRLGDIAAGYGFFFDGHRAASDCFAGVEILSRELPKTGRSALAVLLESARQTRWRVWAEGAPFASRGVLKKRGYRWHAGDDGRPRAWYVDVSESQWPLEMQFLKYDVYRSNLVDIPAYPVTAYDRYSMRD